MRKRPPTERDLVRRIYQRFGRDDFTGHWVWHYGVIGNRCIMRVGKTDYNVRRILFERYLARREKHRRPSGKVNERVWSVAPRCGFARCIRPTHAYTAQVRGGNRQRRWRLKHGYCRVCDAKIKKYLRAPGPGRKQRGTLCRPHVWDRVVQKRTYRLYVGRRRHRRLTMWWLLNLCPQHYGESNHESGV